VFQLLKELEQILSFTSTKYSAELELFCGGRDYFLL